MISLSWLQGGGGAGETASHQVPKPGHGVFVGMGRGDDPYFQAQLGLRLEAGRSGGGVQRGGSQKREV